MQKTFLIEFAYNNSVYSITDMNFFFVIYGFHSNISFMIRDDRSEKKMPAVREVAEKFKSEDKKLAK
jgi:hypothetical protein